MTVVDFGNLLISRLAFVSLYLLIPAALCCLLTRGQSTSQAFRLWVWRGFFVALAVVLGVGPLFHIVLPRESLAGGSGPAPTVAIPLAIWVLGVIFVSVKLAREERTARRLLATCEPVVDGELLKLTAEVGARVGLRKAVDIVSTSACLTPMVVFEKEPVVVLPNWAIATLSREELAQVLAHEMAHIRGRDGAWASFMCLLSGILWFHPVVWLAGKQLAISSEMQADAVALRFSASCPASLANTILLCVTGAQPANVAALSGNGRKLAMRLRALESTHGRLRRWDLLAVVAAVALSAPILPIRQAERAASPGLASPMRIGSARGIYTPMERVAAPVASRVEGP